MMLNVYVATKGDDELTLAEIGSEDYMMALSLVDEEVLTSDIKSVGYKNDKVSPDKMFVFAKTYDDAYFSAQSFIYDEPMTFMEQAWNIFTEDGLDALFEFLDEYPDEFYKVDVFIAKDGSRRLTMDRTEDYIEPEVHYVDVLPPTDDD